MTEAEGAGSATEPLNATEVLTPEVERSSDEVTATESAPAAVTVDAAATETPSAVQAKPERAPSAPIALPAQEGDSGLIKIETDPSKVAQFGSGAVEPPVRLGRKPRPAPVIVEEPLQQVETHK